MPPGEMQIVLPVKTRAAGSTLPVPVRVIAGELPEELATVIVVLWLPTPVGVKVTRKVAVPPSPIIVVEERLETTNCELDDVTVTPVAVAFVFVMV